MLPYHFIEYCPHLGSFLLDQCFCLFDIVDNIFFYKLFHDKRFVKFERHFRGQSALMKAQLRADNNNRTPRIVNPFTQQVLPEPPLLAFEHIL